jgi:hypothetical protein
MRYSDLIQKDLPIAIWALDENISSATSNSVAYNYVGLGTSDPANGTYIYNTSMKCQNKGLPMVMGGGDSTYLLDNGSSHSLSLPRMKTFSQAATSMPSTLEFWLSIKNSTQSFTKILGVSDNSTWGVYSYKNYLVLKINNLIFCSLPVEDWTVPNHIAISYLNNQWSFIVNGQETYCTASLDEASLTSGDFYFYGNDELGYTKIDCPAIYYAEFSNITAKRHLVYGLGFKLPLLMYSANQGVMQNFEDSKVPAIETISVPDIMGLSKTISKNIYLNKFGITVDNKINVEYFHPSTATTFNSFQFTNESNNYLLLGNFGSDTEGSGYAGLIIEPTALQSTNVYESVCDFRDDKSRFTLYFLNNDLILRVYPESKTYESTTYEEATLASDLSVGTEYVVTVGIKNQKYYAEINGAQVDLSLLSNAKEISNNARLYCGVEFNSAAQSDNYTNTLVSAKINQITVFKNNFDLDNLVNSSGSTYLDKFKSYFTNFTITHDYRIKLKRRASLEFRLPLSSFGRSMFDTVNTKNASQMIIKHLYPEITGSEVSVLAYIIDEDSLTEYNCNNPVTVIDNLFATDLTSKHLKVVVSIAAEDALFFPPIVGQIIVKTKGDKQGKVHFSGFEKALTFYSEDGKSNVPNRSYSPLFLGDRFGLQVKGDGAYTDYNYMATDQASGVDGLKSISFLIYTEQATDFDAISWTPVTGSTPPSSVKIFKDGEVYNNSFSITGNKLTKNNLGLSVGTWHHVVLIFNSPLVINKSETYVGPRVLFGGSDAVFSIQTVAFYNSYLSDDKAIESYRSISSVNNFSATSYDTITISEPVSGTLVDSLEWITV